MKRSPIVLSTMLMLLPAVAVAASSTPAEARHSNPVAADVPTAEAAATPAPVAATVTAEEKGTPAPAPTSSNPLANAVQARTPEEQAQQSGFQAVAVLDHWIGVGTFSDPKLYSLLVANLTLQGVYLFSVKGTRLVASGTWRGSYEYTLPDSETGRRFSPYDLRVGLSAPAIWKEKVTGIGFSPSIGASIPSSPESINASLITSLSLGIRLTRSVKFASQDIDLQLAAGGSRGFFVHPEAALRPTSVADRERLLCRTGEAACAGGTANTAWGFNVGGQAQWRLTGELLVYVGYTFIKSWAYDLGGNSPELTAKGTDADGKTAACSGLCMRDKTQAFVGASYQLNEHYSLDLGLATVQQPLDGKRQVRFPWFSTVNDNATTLSFTLSAAY